MSEDRTQVAADAASGAFALSISLGNEAMQTTQDIAGALQAVAERLSGGVLGDFDAGPIRDVNGNQVGAWEVQP